MIILFKKTHRNWKQILGLFILILFSSIGQMLLPSFLAQMINQGVTIKKTSNIYIYGIIMAFITVFSCVINFLSVKLASYISTDFSAQVRSQVFSQIQSYSNAEFDHFGTPSLITRSTSDITNVQHFLTLLLRVGLLAPMMCVAGVVFSTTTGGKISAVLLISIPILLIALSILMVLASKYSLLLRKKLDQINRLFLESLDGVRVIRAFHKEQDESSRFQRANRDFATTAMTVGRVRSFLMPVINVIFGGTTAAILGSGSYYVESGEMDVASLIANIQYINMVLTSVMMFALVIMVFPTSYACAKRIANVLETNPSIVGGNFSFDKRPLRNTVEFRHITFAYPDATQAVLKDISFTAKPGEITAIIGGTGHGKSSIVKLIPRLYDSTLGEVLVDGVNVRDYALKDLRNLISYVPQKNILFSGDLAYNLNFGKENGQKDDWERASRIACADEFIRKKENAFQSSIAEGGTNFSGGQKQRLAIARALMKKSEIYIFDDSFSALDMKTDQKLRQNLKESLGDATVIMVAQRLSTILNADQILVLDDGEIVGKGTHENLLKTCPLYKEIAEIQLGKEAL